MRCKLRADIDLQSGMVVQQQVQVAKCTFLDFKLPVLAVVSSRYVGRARRPCKVPGSYLAYSRGVSMDSSVTHAAEPPRLASDALSYDATADSTENARAIAALVPPPPSLPVMRPSGSKFTSVETISFAEDMNARYRSTMEDACVVIDGFGGDAGTGYFAIMDGHGGRNVAEFLRLHLHVSIDRELRIKGDRSIEECFKSAFLITDAEASVTGEQASGSTAVVCIVRRQGAKRYVYTANCGDARAVLCHAGTAVRLSLDHKATDAVEKARIEAAGGFVLRKRVMGVLAVARSFGDFILKKFVSAEPYTSTTKLDETVSAQ